jgi:hypothetical protein
MLERAVGMVVQNLRDGRDVVRGARRFHYCVEGRRLNDRDGKLRMVGRRLMTRARRRPLLSAHRSWSSSTLDGSGPISVTRRRRCMVLLGTQQPRSRERHAQLTGFVALDAAASASRKVGQNQRIWQLTGRTSERS